MLLTPWELKQQRERERAREEAARLREREVRELREREEAARLRERELREVREREEYERRLRERQDYERDLRLRERERERDREWLLSSTSSGPWFGSGGRSTIEPSSTLPPSTAPKLGFVAPPSHTTLREWERERREREREREVAYGRPAYSTASYTATSSSSSSSLALSTSSSYSSPSLSSSSSSSAMPFSAGYIPIPSRTTLMEMGAKRTFSPPPSRTMMKSLGIKPPNPLTKPSNIKAKARRLPGTTATTTTTTTTTTFSKATASFAPRNDYSQHFVDTGERPQNFIRDTKLHNRFEEYDI